MRFVEGKPTPADFLPWCLNCPESEGWPCATRRLLAAQPIPPLDVERLAKAIDEAERDGGNYRDMRRHRWLAKRILVHLQPPDPTLARALSEPKP